MVRFALAVLAAFAVVSAPMSALAQRAPETTPRSKPTVVTFEGPQHIAGEIERPGLNMVFAPAKTTFPTLVKVRTSFADELAPTDW